MNCHNATTRVLNIPARKADSQTGRADARMRMRVALRVAVITLAATACVVWLEHAKAADLPERVTFRSADGKTMLTGYVFESAAMPPGRVPAVVMMHGRSGAYSMLAKGI